MATVKSVLDDLFTVKELSKICRTACEETRFKLLASLIPDLSCLERTVSDIRMVIFRPAFKEEPFAEEVLAKVHKHAERAKNDLQFANDIVTSFLNAKREAGRLRAEKLTEPKDVQKSRVDVRTFTRFLQRLQDAIEGREDWSRLSPREPRPPSPVSDGSSSKRSSPNLMPPVQLKVTISAPPSPLQPTVEDAEDDAEDEPSNVQNYHYVHEESTSAEDPKGKDKVLATPPSVLVRAPTDPMTENDLPNDISQDQPKLPLKSAMKRPSPPMSNEDLEPSNGAPGGRPRQPRIETQSLSGRALEEAQKKALLLEAELEELRSPDSSPWPRTATLPPRTQHTSIDYGSEGLHPHSQSRRPPRQRANTATGLERPTELQREFESERRTSPRHERPAEYSGSSDRSRDSPLHSRQSQRNPRSSQPNLGRDMQDDASAYYSSRPRSMDGRSSLPSLLEPGGAGSQGAFHRNAPPSMRYSPRGHHLDQGYEDFFRQGNSKAGDFSLFDDTAEGSESRRETRTSPRSSPNSRDAWRPVIEHELFMPLEELFTGTERTANINRRVHGVEEDIQVRIPIYPGLRPGSKIKFAGRGDITERGKQDIHFVVRQAPHPVFEWKDRDLYAKIEIPLASALLGWEKPIRTVCGKTVRVSHPGPTPPGWKEYYAGLGMCSRKDPNIRGDMIVSVSIVWPRPGSLTDRQKELLRQALMPGTPRGERAGGGGVY